MISPEMALLYELRTKWNLWGCTEVTSYYDCKADILAVHPHKQLVYEFEFKRYSQDLKVAELKKEKYKLQKTSRWLSNKEKELLKTKESYFTCKQEPLKPHIFYYVVSRDLWEKEKDYLASLKHEGVLIWDYKEIKNKRFIEFTKVKRTKTISKNTYKYEVVCRDILSRATSYVAYSQKHWEDINDSK